MSRGNIGRKTREEPRENFGRNLGKTYLCYEGHVLTSDGDRVELMTMHNKRRSLVTAPSPSLLIAN